MGQDFFLTVAAKAGFAGEYEPLVESEFAAVPAGSYIPAEDGVFRTVPTTAGRTIQLLQSSPVYIETFQSSEAILRMPSGSTATNDAEDGRFYFIKNKGQTGIPSDGVLTIQDQDGIAITTIAIGNTFIILHSENDDWDALNITTTVPIGRTVIVAKSGGDETTIAAGIIAAIAKTPIISNPVTILVYPGVYTEAPLTLPAFVNMASAGGAEVTEIAASTTTSPLLMAPANVRITGCKFSGANGVGGVGVQFGTAGQRTRIDACLIVDCTVGLLATGTGVQVFADAIVILRRTGEVAGEAFKAAAGGNMFCFSCRANGETGVLHAAGYVSTGTDSVLTTNGGQAIFCTSGVQATLGGLLVSASMRFEGCTQSRRVGPGASGELTSTAGIGLAVTWDALVDGATATLELGGDEITAANLSLLTDTTISGFYIDHETSGDQAMVVINELNVGRPEEGHESVFGEGDSYVRGMVVLTTDGTAGASADGGNLTDVSVNAASASGGSTFAFQGVTAGHAIMFGSSLSNVDGVLKHWGLKLKVTTAAVEVTARSFVFEIWDGTNWVAEGAMSTSSGLYHRYGSAHFIRASNSEHVRYGIDQNTTWATKLISGSTLYWSRIRIATTITTSPTFEQSKLHPSRSEINSDGTHTFHGLSRFRLSLTSGGNAFGESGGVADFTPAIGSGGVPSGWNHSIKNSLLGGSGDAIYTHFPLPWGVDTSHKLFIDITYNLQVTHGDDDADLICSIKPMEVAGQLVADPAGGITPVARTLANTATIVATAAQVDSTTGINIPTSVGDKIQSLRFGPFTVEDFYEGDMVAVRIELDEDGATNPGIDLGIWTVSVTGVIWTHGEKL